MISHKHNCIFIHIPKNAGQSMEHVFLDLAGLTWETRAPLLLRPNDKSEIGPPRLAHLKARDYVKYQYISQELFDNYFKFAFVRNPWDRMVSIYKFSRYSLILDFNSFYKHIFLPKMWHDKYWFVGPQSDFICDQSGKIIMDFVGRFETLQSDFTKICQMMGLPDINLPHVNKSTQKVNQTGFQFKKILRRSIWNIQGKKLPIFKNYRDYYDEKTKNDVGELYRSDIEIFGYTFD